jgi:hypothetical protein
MVRRIDDRIMMRLMSPDNYYKTNSKTELNEMRNTNNNKISFKSESLLKNSINTSDFNNDNDLVNAIESQGSVLFDSSHDKYYTPTKKDNVQSQGETKYFILKRINQTNYVISPIRTPEV